MGRGLIVEGGRVNLGVYVLISAMVSLLVFGGLVALSYKASAEEYRSLSEKIELENVRVNSRQATRTPRRNRRSKRREQKVKGEIGGSKPQELRA